MLDVALTLLLLSAASASATTRYVWQGSSGPAPPYTNWTSAAHFIQNAVDAAQASDEIVVTNGTYATGGRAAGTNVLVNRVTVDKPLTVWSVNGPQFTIIQGHQVPGTTNGDGAIRCVYLTNGASLSGFTLTNGATRSDGDYNREQGGGGVWCESTNVFVTNCVMAGNSAYNYGGGAYNGTLRNCTLTGNSAGYYGGGAYSCTLNNCTLTSNSAGSSGGGVAGTLNTPCTLNDCTLTGNSASSGGGAWSSTLNNCTLTGNSASSGGGGVASGVEFAVRSTLNNCTLSGNSAAYGGGAANATLNNCTLANNWVEDYYDGQGGGAYYSTLNNCTLTGNWAAGTGGGAYYGTLNNCTLANNWVEGYYYNGYYYVHGLGGGAYQTTLNGCTLTGNWAAGTGGGAYYGTLNNCTLTGNSASSGGGAYYGTLNNCIVYFNTAPDGPNYSDSTMNYCCTTPLPASGTGNISLDPRLASAWHLSATSPCRGRGSATYASGADIDGEAWASPPSIGCDEYHAGAVSGPLTVAIATTYTNVAVGCSLGLKALIEGRTTASVWEFGDGLVLSNRPYAGHVWSAPGDYAVVLRAYNESQPGGVTATVTIHVVTPPVHYVAADSANPVPPYASWATAATNIQDAVDAATVPGALLLVTNGLYAAGGRAVVGTAMNRVAVDKPLTVRSVNGPEVTVVQGAKASGGGNGYGAIRCVYLANGASLSGFTLTHGATRTDGDSLLYESGGGVWCESTNVFVTNCVMAGNSAYNYGGGAYNGTLCNCTLTGNSAGYYGGGAYSCTLNNCTLTGNLAGSMGGGAMYGMLNHCTLTGNSASSGGGAYSATLNNCIVYFNSAAYGPNHGSSTLRYCCTTPLPASGTGNISDDPELASASHLSVFSPCRGAGSAAYTSGVDIDGEAWGTPPSIGCDEYHAGAVTGPLSVGIVAAYTNVAVGFSVGLTAQIEGRTMLSIWDFGDETLSLDRPYATHAWTAPGDYVVSLWAFNDSHPDGASATVTIHVGQGLHYVAVGSTNPVAPYTSWATAATNIQDAVDAAVVGGTVLVTNGTYGAGGRAVGTSLLVNRVAVDKVLTVRSVNGPQFTVIQGRQVPGTTNGNGAIRCVYLASGAILSGFTLTHGATQINGDYEVDQSGGGVWCESATVVVSNCVLVGNSASGGGGGASGGTLNNCTLTGNSASLGGGGARESTLNNCTLTGNSATDSGGGADGGTLNNCTLTGNSATDSGGGAYYGTLCNCTLTGNSASSGGGASLGRLNNCTLTGNSASYGGGAYYGTLNNCTLTSNSAYVGGGAHSGTLNNCTVTGNSAVYGGGAWSGTLNNCIVYFNTARNGPNHYSSTLGYCCTTPLPGSGTGNISLDPQLASASHLSATSPCRGTGSAMYASGADIDGEAWASPPSIGCDEYHAGAITGPLRASILTAFTNVAVGFPVGFTALTEGPTRATVWDFGDGMVTTNQPFTTHAWATPGNYAVVLRAYNDSHPAGVTATVMIHVVASPIHYVAVGSTNPVPPYTSWATAAKNIQDAVDAFDAGVVPGACVLVTNGVYQTGGRVVSGALTNRVVIHKLLTVRSVNGPQFTVIQGRQVPGTTNGSGAIRCVYLASGASLSGFTLTNGATSSSGGNDILDRSGGGVWCESVTAVVSDCVLVRNSAYYYGGGAYYGTVNNCTVTGNSASYGGGADYGTLNNCTVTGNSAISGGGAYSCTLNNCTLTGNSASSGGGASGGTLNNCIVYFNMAPSGANYYSSTLSYCCTMPIPGGVGNITNAPLFVDYDGGNLRLQSNSPCINAGTNYFAPGSTDLDGRPRIVGARVDIGAYEFQGAGMGEFIGWLQHYSLPTDGSADYTDPDADGHNNWQEWRCQTDPTNALSVLRLLTPETDGTNVTVRWSSVAGVSYYLLRSAHLTVPSAYRLLATNILGQAGTTSYTDTNAARRSALFYRVGVGNYIAPPSPPPPTLTCQYDGGTRMLQLSWEAPDAQLQEAATPNGPWQTVTTAVSPYWTATAYPQRFYRLILPAPGKKWLTVAAVTMTAQTNTAANLQTIFSYMEQAASDGVDLVVFPEIALQQCPAWGPPSHTPTPQEMAYVRQTAETIPGQSTSNLVTKANELNLFVVFGMAEKDAAGLLYNTSVLLGPDGVLGKHRKRYLWDSNYGGNEQLIWLPGQVWDVVASPLGKVGLMICIEMGAYPGRVLANQGADLLVTSAAFPTGAEDYWESFTRDNASQAKRWHVVSDQVGVAGHVNCDGRSRVVDPKGTIVCDTGTGAGLVMWATDILIDARAP